MFLFFYINSWIYSMIICWVVEEVRHEQQSLSEVMFQTAVWVSLLSAFINDLRALMYLFIKGNQKNVPLHKPLASILVNRYIYIYKMLVVDKAEVSSSSSTLLVQCWSICVYIYIYIPQVGLFCIGIMWEISIWMATQ